MDDLFDNFCLTQVIFVIRLHCINLVILRVANKDITKQQLTKGERHPQKNWRSQAVVKTGCVTRNNFQVYIENFP